MGYVFALFAEQLLVFLFLSAADRAAAFLALLVRIVLAFLANFDFVHVLLDFFGQIRAEFANLIQVFGGLVAR